MNNIGSDHLQNVDAVDRELSQLQSDINHRFYSDPPANQRAIEAAARAFLQRVDALTPRIRNAFFQQESQLTIDELMNRLAQGARSALNAVGNNESQPPAAPAA